MKKTIDWTNKKIVDIYDEVSLWSAPFGRLLLENIPMRAEAKIVDIGFGTGFPLIELSQRFGENSKIYGIDIWHEAINRTKEKIELMELKNIEIIEKSASQINIENESIDLVTSNLGVNNFEEKELVYSELNRILKKGGRLCITTNPIGTFEELFELFRISFKSMKLNKEMNRLEAYVNRRNTKKGIILELEKFNFKLIKFEIDSTNIRFVNAEALMNHSLIRIGFRESWEGFISQANRKEFFDRVIENIEKIIASRGEFRITVPMLFLEFEKK